MQLRSFLAQKQVRPPGIEVVGSLESGSGTALVIEDEDMAIGLDCGANPASGNTLLQWRAAQRIILRMVLARLKFLVISHYHWDHYGQLLSVLEEMQRLGIPLPTIVATDMTLRLLQRHLAPFKRQIRFKSQTDRITLFENRHSVPGSAAVQYRFKCGKRLLYSGDCFDMDVPADLAGTDLLIMDSTGAARDFPRPDIELKIRKNILALISETRQRGSDAYIALFSSQFDRAVWIQEAVKEMTGFLPAIIGRSLLDNLEVYSRFGPGSVDSSHVALCTGVWAQGGAGLTDADSALVRLSKESYPDCRLKPGDLVVLSGSIPTWSLTLTSQIRTMCRRLQKLGVRVVVDTSAPDDWIVFALHRQVHAGGHGHMPEIMGLIDVLKPQRVLPFHAAQPARWKVGQYCLQRGIGVVDETTLPYIVV